MQFNSLGFLFLFLPLMLFFYYIVPEKRRNGVLLIFSLAFYVLSNGKAYWNVFFLILYIGISFLLGKWMPKHRKGVLIFSVVFLFGSMIFGKIYAGGSFYPLGFSFLIFQMAAYLTDVFCRVIPPETSLVRYATQISMFPKLLSGPLMRPSELVRQTWGRGYFSKNIHYGIQKLILGLSMKVLIADRVVGLWNCAKVIGYKSISIPFAWIALLGYCICLYFDFFGYSLMAEGLGQMLGFNLPENFHDPYASGSVSEFFRRWHATLGKWFRDYVYFPLGGSRKGKFRTVLNIGIVWILTALWHGFQVNFLIWAAALFVLIVNEKLWLGKILEKAKIFSHIYTVFFITISWLPFAISSVPQMGMFAGRLFGFTGTGLNPLDFVPMLKQYGVYLFGGILLATPIPRMIYEKKKDSIWLDVVLFLVFWTAVYFLSISEYDSFLYFRF